LSSQSCRKRNGSKQSDSANKLRRKKHIADEYVIGINGAGWNFYDGVWGRLYDVCGIH
jgi:hypothetical protein